jgi:Smg protein
LKERMLGIVHLIVDRILEQNDLEKNNIVESLISEGYNPREIIDAFAWIKDFSMNIYQHKGMRKLYDKPKSFRVLTAEERMRFSAEAWSFVIKLREMGIINDALREEIIDKAFALIDDEVELDDMMIVASLVLFKQSYSVFKDGFLEQFQHGNKYLVN